MNSFFSRRDFYGSWRGGGGFDGIKFWEEIALNKQSQIYPGERLIALGGRCPLQRILWHKWEVLKWVNIWLRHRLNISISLCKPCTISFLYPGGNENFSKLVILKFALKNCNLNMLVYCNLNVLLQYYPDIGSIVI